MDAAREARRETLPCATASEGACGASLSDGGWNPSASTDDDIMVMPPIVTIPVRLVITNIVDGVPSGLGLDED